MLRAFCKMNAITARRVEKWKVVDNEVAGEFWIVFLWNFGSF